METQLAVQVHSQNLAGVRQWTGAAGAGQSEGASDESPGGRPSSLKKGRCGVPRRLTLGFHERQQLCAHISSAIKVCLHGHLCLNMEGCGVLHFEDRENMVS